MHVAYDFFPEEPMFAGVEKTARHVVSHRLGKHFMSPETIKMWLIG